MVKKTFLVCDKVVSCISDLTYSSLEEIPVTGKNIQDYTLFIAVEVRNLYAASVTQW